MVTFKEFSLLPQIQQALDTLGFTTPTEIQAQAIPALINRKTDVHGQAQTGTGKTLAFGIPLLQSIDINNKSVQGLIVAPTRELVVQICKSLQDVAQFMNVSIVPIYGGVSMYEQFSQLRKGAHIIVGTPGRLNDHLRRKTLVLNKLTTLVLDEADIMLDMGFKEEVDEILKFAPESRQIWLFSATVKPGIAQLMQTHLKNPISIRISKQQVGTSNTKQYYCMVNNRDKFVALCRLIDNAPLFYGFVFCQTKMLTAEVAEQLIIRGYKVSALHGDMSQAQRNKVIQQFKNKECTIVVATDVAARGIDIADLTHVINYSLPDDHESYVHRIGRTGRAGKEGIAISFANNREMHKISLLKRKFNIDIQPLSIPTADVIAQVRINQAEEALVKICADTSLTGYLKQLKTKVSNYNHENLINAVTHLLYEKYLQQVAEQQTVSKTVERTYDYDMVDHGHERELVIALGTDDGITKSDMLMHINKYALVKPEQLSKVKVIKRRSFIMLPAQQAEVVFRALKGKELKGKRARIDFVQERQAARFER